jgi:hypothetical protein
MGLCLDLEAVEPMEAFETRLLSRVAQAVEAGHEKRDGSWKTGLMENGTLQPY